MVCIAFSMESITHSSETQNDAEQQDEDQTDYIQKEGNNLQACLQSNTCTVLLSCFVSNTHQGPQQAD